MRDFGMNAEQVAKLIAGLENVRARPAMYFGGLDVEVAAHWLHGFEFAIQVLFDLDVDFGSREEVWQSHGLELGGMGPDMQLTQRGLSPKAIIDKLLMMDIERLKRLESR
jgi:hypothetical protein